MDSFSLGSIAAATSGGDVEGKGSRRGRVATSTAPLATSGNEPQRRHGDERRLRREHGCRDRPDRRGRDARLAQQARSQLVPAARRQHGETRGRQPARQGAPQALESAVDLHAHGPARAPEPRRDLVRRSIPEEQRLDDLAVALREARERVAHGRRGARAPGRSRPDPRSQLRSSSAASKRRAARRRAASASRHRIPCSHGRSPRAGSKACARSIARRKTICTRSSASPAPLARCAATAKSSFAVRSNTAASALPSPRARNAGRARSRTASFIGPISTWRPACATRIPGFGAGRVVPGLPLPQGRSRAGIAFDPRGSPPAGDQPPAPRTIQQSVPHLHLGTAR